MRYRIGSSARADLPWAIVVGAGAMGVAIARRLAQQNRVLIADIHPDIAEQKSALLREEGCDVRSIVCDVTSRDAVSELAAQVSELGGFSVLAHVAGLSPSLGDFQSIMRVNLRGMGLVIEALLPHARRGSAAILIASLAAHNFTPADLAVAALNDATADTLVERLTSILGPSGATPQAAYVHSKWGVLALARRQSAQWAASGARINSLSPGLIATTQGALEFQNSAGKRRIFDMSPMRREGTMLEIADAVEFLASPRASFINGTDLLVDGGLAAVLGQQSVERDLPS